MLRDSEGDAGEQAYGNHEVEGDRHGGRRPVRAARGTTLTARQWSTEAPLRMLMNNLDPEVAERPDDLRRLWRHRPRWRDWRSFDAMVRTLLTDLRADETMLVQSAPGRRLRTHEWALRVLIANSNLCSRLGQPAWSSGDWSTSA